MYDPPDKAPPAGSDIPAVMASQAAAGLSLSRRRAFRDRRYPAYQAAGKNSKKAEYREVLQILQQTCAELKLEERNLHISLLEIPDGFLLKAYDCSSNRQVCREIRERFFFSPEKIEKLLREILSGTGILLDIDG